MMIMRDNQGRTRLSLDELIESHKRAAARVFTASAHMKLMASMHVAEVGGDLMTMLTPLSFGLTDDDEGAEEFANRVRAMADEAGAYAVVVVHEMWTVMRGCNDTTPLKVRPRDDPDRGEAMILVVEHEDAHEQALFVAKIEREVPGDFGSKPKLQEWVS